MKIELNRLNDAVHFEARNEDGNTVLLDGSPKIGGEGLGARPMQQLLMSLAGCSSMDICSILKKQRQPLEKYRVEAEGERDYDKEPAVFKKIHLTFHFEGELDRQKIERALYLSVRKYCSVARMLEKTADITYHYTLNRKLFKPVNQ